MSINSGLVYPKLLRSPLLYGQGIAAGASFTNSRSLSANVNDEYLGRSLEARTSARIGTLSFWHRPADTANEAMAYGQQDSSADPQDAGVTVATYLSTAFTGTTFTLYDGGGFTWFASNLNELSDDTWYHIVVSVDTTQATSTNRIKIYVNGSDDTDTLGANYPAQNTDVFLGSTFFEFISPCVASFDTNHIDEISFIDGQALTPSSFATANLPIDISGLTFGNSGWWLRFEGSTAATFGTDSSGNSNTFTQNNFEDADSSTTVPT
jgi:hypothetical protein